MIYDTGEYDVLLDIPTDNFVFYHFLPHHSESISDFLHTVAIPNNDTLVIIFSAFHCIQETDYWVQPLNDFCKNIPNKVVVFTGRLTPNPQYNLPNINFEFHRISMFDYVSNFYWNVKEENQTRNWSEDCHRSRNKKFYWASTKDWYTRRFILAGLIKHDLLNDGITNYKCLHTDIPSMWIERIAYNNANYIQQECDSIAHLIPLPAVDNTIEFPQTNVNFYLDTYLGIVTDTFFEQGVFLSEKVFNAMNYQQIFFYMGCHNSIKYLRDQGYHTFDDIIDTSYDSIEDTGKRLLAARESLISFLSQPLDKIKLCYQKSILGINHNKNLLQKQRPDLQFTEILKKIIV